MKLIGKFCLVILIFCTVFSCKSPKLTDNYYINKGDFKATITETGELQAVEAKYVFMPYIGWEYGWQYKIIGMVDHGTLLEKGDSIIQIDKSTVMKFKLEQENKLEVEKAMLNKLIVEQQSKANELESQIKQAQANYNLIKIELEKFKFESERKKEIKELELQQAEINLNKIQRAIELDKKICENALKIQKIKVFQLENKIKDSDTALTKLKIFSPIKGIFQISINRRTDELFRIGDETWQGANLACVPDLRKMKVKSTVNETDIAKVDLGQKVIVRLDAFPALTFEGNICQIGKLSYKKDENSPIKVFDFEVLLIGSDPVLKPGLTVSCEIFYAELNDVFYVANDCILRENGQYYIFLKNKDGSEKHLVNIGSRNTKHTVIYGDFRKGHELVLPGHHEIAGQL